MTGMAKDSISGLKDIASSFLPSAATGAGKGAGLMSGLTSGLTSKIKDLGSSLTDFSKGGGGANIAATGLGMA
jgi:hypothetical protein